MKLIIVRHGETEENAKGICQGQHLGTLSKKGIEQAKKLGERLKDEKIDKIYVSDLKRTKDTAKEIIKHHPKTEVEYTPALRERCWGIYEGMEGKEIEKALEKIEKDYKHKDLTPEKGESGKDVEKRVAEFAKKLIKEHKETILLVSHGGTIMHLLLHLFKQDWEQHEQYKHHNCALTILEITEKERKIITLNCCKHLN